MATKADLRERIDGMGDDEHVFAVFITAADIIQWFKDNKREEEIPASSAMYNALRNLEDNIVFSDTICLANELADLCEELSTYDVLVEVTGGVVDITKKNQTVKVKLVDYDNEAGGRGRRKRQ